MTVHARRVALITDSELGRQALMALLGGALNPLIVTIDVSQSSQPLIDYLGQHHDSQLDMWVLDSSAQHDENILHILCDDSDKPILVNDELPTAQDEQRYKLWQKRLLQKVESLSLENDGLRRQRLGTAEQVWVLAASLGGPAMIKRFLSALPQGLPIAFVYAQHIEANFDHYLSGGMGSEQAYPLQQIRTEHSLVAGETLVVPADAQLRFLPFGQVIKTTKAWQGPYQPAIDQVVAELAKEYRKKLGVIVFSGTCNDGEIGCRVVKACGGQVWAQSPASCVSAAMPEAAINTGCVSFQGTPEELAQQLAQIIKQPVAQQEVIG
ncbi:chemotaxis protein CheB [Dasania marina]|uniref:chemotaxis protein CheB n=1 Tax=Dasania marina TaxID=471499 RepID=UPI0030DB704A